MKAFVRLPRFLQRVSGRLAFGVASLVVAAAPTAWTPAAAADGNDARAQLQRFVKEVRTASGSFEQTTLNADGRVIDEQRGEFLFARPGRFRWEVTEPFPQLVVADDEQVIQFDPDLLQASIRPADAAVGSAPAQVLFGEGDIDEAFAIESLAREGELAWLRARPESAETGFAHLDIGLLDGLPQEVEILDAFGQTSRIVFTQIVPNPELPDDAFQFEAPEGVDVVRMP